LLRPRGLAWIVDHVILGHARPKLLRTYMPTLPLGEARGALERWGRELAAILQPGSDFAQAGYYGSRTARCRSAEIDPNGKFSDHYLSW
jgi:hypothetical protein